MVTDREKLLITLQNRINDGRNRHTKTTTIFISTLSACMAIVKEHKEGEWIEHLFKHGDERYECCFCHCRSALPTPYCKWCGTKMLKVVSTVG